MRFPLTVIIIFALLLSGTSEQDLADNVLTVPGIGGDMVIETILRECPAGNCSDDDVQKMAAWVDGTPEFSDPALKSYCARGILFSYSTWFGKEGANWSHPFRELTKFCRGMGQCHPRHRLVWQSVLLLFQRNATIRGGFAASLVASENKRIDITPKLVEYVDAKKDNRTNLAAFFRHTSDICAFACRFLASTDVAFLCILAARETCYRTQQLIPVHVPNKTPKTRYIHKPISSWWNKAWKSNGCDDPFEGGTWATTTPTTTVTAGSSTTVRPENYDKVAVAAAGLGMAEALGVAGIAFGAMVGGTYGI